jgi:hypothetical protein
MKKPQSYNDICFLWNIIYSLTIAEETLSLSPFWEPPTAYHITNCKDTTQNMTNMIIGLWWRFHCLLSLRLHSLLMVEVRTRFWCRDKKLMTIIQKPCWVYPDCLAIFCIFIIQSIRPTVYICHLFRAQSRKSSAGSLTIWEAGYEELTVYDDCLHRFSSYAAFNSLHRNQPPNIADKEHHHSKIGTTPSKLYAKHCWYLIWFTIFNWRLRPMLFDKSIPYIAT